MQSTSVESEVKVLLFVVQGLLWPLRGCMFPCLSFSPISPFLLYSSILYNDWQVTYMTSHLDYILYAKIFGSNFSETDINSVQSTE